jgi:hypothetical protein
MSIPGFTGAASIYDTTGVYRMGCTHGDGGSVVRPALSWCAIQCMSAPPEAFGICMSRCEESYCDGILIKGICYHVHFPPPHLF